MDSRLNITEHSAQATVGQTVEYGPYKLVSGMQEMLADNIAHQTHLHLEQRNPAEAVMWLAVQHPGSSLCTCYPLLWSRTRGPRHRLGRWTRNTLEEVVTAGSAHWHCTSRNGHPGRQVAICTVAFHVACSGLLTHAAARKHVTSVDPLLCKTYTSSRITSRQGRICSRQPFCQYTQLELGISRL